MALQVGSIIDVQLVNPDGTTTGDHGTVAALATNYIEITNTASQDIVYPWTRVVDVIVTG